MSEEYGKGSQDLRTPDEKRLSDIERRISAVERILGNRPISYAEWAADASPYSGRAKTEQPK